MWKIRRHRVVNRESLVTNMRSYLSSDSPFAPNTAWMFGITTNRRRRRRRTLSPMTERMTSSHRSGPSDCKFGIDFDQFFTGLDVSMNKARLNVFTAVKVSDGRRNLRGAPSLSW